MAARSTLIDTGGVDLEDHDPLAVSIQDQAREALADADVALLVVDAQAGLPCRRRGGRRHAAQGRPAGRPGREQDRHPRTSPSSHDFHGLGLGEPLAGVGRAGARHRRPARPARRAAARGRRAGGRRGHRPPRGDRAPERRQVLARQRVPRPRARDRLRHRRHHARRDRHPDRGRRPRACCWSTPPASAARRRSTSRSSTTRRCARSGRPSAPTSRSSCATRPTA